MSKSLRNIGVVASLTVVSRVLGLMRDQLSAGVFGTTLLNSAFITAFSLPNLFRRLLGEGSLTAAFVPTLQDELHENNRLGAFRLLSQVTSWLGLVTIALVGLGMLVFSHSRWLGGHEEKWYLAADLTVILFPYLVLVCLAAAFNATLNVFERFTEPALSPIWLNISMILALGGGGLLLARTPMGRMHWLCAGVLAGGFLQMAVPAAVLVRKGWRPKLDLAVSPRVREIALLMAPGLFGTAIYQVNIYVSRLLAYSINDSAASILFYANRLTELPIGVFAIAVATVVYPLIAGHAAAKDLDSMARDYRKGIRLIVLVNVPAAAGMAVLAVPIVRLLFQHGAFTATATREMAPLLALFAIGMPFFSVASLTIRAFYAVKDTVTPVKLAAVSFVVNLGLALALMRSLEAAGLVIASTVAIIVQTIALQRLLVRRLPGLAFAPLWKTVAKVAVASAVMAVVVAAGWLWLRHLGQLGRWRDVAAVGGLIPIGVAIYGAALWVLRVEERAELTELWRKLKGAAG